MFRILLDSGPKLLTLPLIEILIQFNFLFRQYTSVLISGKKTVKNFINKELAACCVFLWSINILFSLSPLFFKGISALVELPKNCVAAAVGKELSEYLAFSSVHTLPWQLLIEILMKSTLLELCRQSKWYRLGCGQQHFFFYHWQRGDNLTQ